MNILNVEKLLWSFLCVPQVKYDVTYCKTQLLLWGEGAARKPLRQHDTRSHPALRQVSSLRLKLLTDGLRRVHVGEVFDVVTSVSSQQHVKDSLGFNDPFFWEKEENRDRRTQILGTAARKVWKGGAQFRGQWNREDSALGI